ncbi:hypothetical protein X755_26800 [Mesorhizobium sp. LNJC405B00]|nr:hypothetical protein X755_26800 [Mesorhizobium sp. LNJC405B00]
MSATMSDRIGARSAVSAGAAATGALGRTTELVVSFDGCKPSTPAVDEQPASHSDANMKLTTAEIRIWTCTQNTTDRRQTDAAGQTGLDY